MSPTARSLALLRERGYEPNVVERRHGGKLHDLYGFIDILAIHGRTGEVLGVQATDGSNLSKRVQKVTDHENLGLVRKAGWSIAVWGWRKNAKNRWVCREVDLS